MEQIIGIFLNDNTVDIKKKLNSVCDNFDYGVVFDIDNCDKSLREDIQYFINRRSYKLIAFICFPREWQNSDATNIATTLQPGGDRTKFIKFIENLCGEIKTLTNRFSIVFASSSGDSKKFRVSEGSLDKLKELLSLPCSWQQEYYIPKTDVLWCSDDHPLVYTVVIS